MLYEDKSVIQFYPTPWHTRKLAPAVSLNDGIKLLYDLDVLTPVKKLADEKIVRLTSGAAVDNTALIQAARELICMRAKKPVDRFKGEDKQDKIILFMNTTEAKAKANNMGNYNVPYDVAKLFGQNSESWRSSLEPDKTIDTVSAHIFSINAWQAEGICKYDSQLCRYFELLATTVQNPTWGIPDGISFHLHIFVFQMPSSYYLPVDDKILKSYAQIFTETRKESQGKLSEYLRSALDLPAVSSDSKIAIALSGGGYFSHCACAGTFSGMFEMGKPATVFENVDVFSATDGGCWFLIQLAFSGKFFSSLTEDPENWVNTGYIGLTKAYWKQYLFDQQAYAENDPTKDLSRVTRLAPNLRSYDWTDFCVKTVFRPFGMRKELKDMKFSDRLDWAKGKQLIACAAMLTEKVVLDETWRRNDKDSANVVSLINVEGKEQTNFSPVRLGDQSVDSTVFNCGDILLLWQDSQNSSDSYKKMIPKAFPTKGYVLDAAISASGILGHWSSMSLNKWACIPPDRLLYGADIFGSISLLTSVGIPKWLVVRNNLPNSLTSMTYLNGKLYAATDDNRLLSCSISNIGAWKLICMTPKVLVGMAASEDLIWAASTSFIWKFNLKSNLLDLVCTAPGGTTAIAFANGKLYLSTIYNRLLLWENLSESFADWQYIGYCPSVSSMTGIGNDLYIMDAYNSLMKYEGAYQRWWILADGQWNIILTAGEQFDTVHDDVKLNDFGFHGGDKKPIQKLDSSERRLRSENVDGSKLEQKYNTGESKDDDITSKFSGPVFVMDIPDLGDRHGRKHMFQECEKENITYSAARYQYAFTSMPESEMNPRLIVFPDNDDDIIEAIKYARQCRCAIAIRSGGHNYVGASSTDCRNIQIDVSGKLFKGTQYPYHTYQYDKDTNRARCGTGLTWGESIELFHNDGVFVPGGQCRTVHIGGHCQTGGVGFMMAAFGLQADWVYAIEIITADLQKLYITRDTTNTTEADLFFSTIGGSPGNFGIITHVTYNCLKDSDYPRSVGAYWWYKYEENSFRKLIDKFWQDAADNILPEGYSLDIQLLNADEPDDVDDGGLDYLMCKKHPKLYGYEDNKCKVMNQTVQIVWVWANLNGENETYNKDYLRSYDGFLERIPNILVRLAGFSAFDDTEHTPMSTMIQNFCYKKVREFKKPFIKRGYMWDYEHLRDFEISGKNHMDFYIKYIQYFSKYNVAAGFTNLASRQTAFHVHDNKTSYSWRNSAIMTIVDIFAPKDDLDAIEDMWVLHDRLIVEADKEGIIFSDHNMIWCCNIGESFAKGIIGRPSLDFEFWKFFDSREKYRRIYNAKRLWDPDSIFTPNVFSVGYFPCLLPDEKAGVPVYVSARVDEELKKESVNNLNNQTLILTNKLYAHDRLTELETEKRGMGTTAKKITRNCFWRLEEDKNKLGWYYIYSAASESRGRIEKSGHGDSDVGIQNGSHSDDQLWKFVDCGDGFYRIYNYKHRGARLAKWGKNDDDWGTCYSELGSNQLWKHTPRYKAQIKKDIVWKCDNRMGSRDFSQKVAVTVGLKVTNSEMVSFTAGLHYSLKSAVDAANEGAENEAIDIDKKHEIYCALSRHISLDKNRPWSETIDITFTAPAGKQYRVCQLICDFQSPLEEDNLTVGCSYSMEETDITSFRLRSHSSMSLKYI